METTARIWRQIASSLVKGIKFTTDCPHQHPEGMVPILDFQAKIVTENLGTDPDGEELLQDRIIHKFYKKPTANWLLVQEMGALPVRSKNSTLAAEVIRRMRNTSMEMEDSTKASIISTFTKAMESSGYCELARAEAVFSGLSGYRNLELRREREGGWLEMDAAWDSRGKRQFQKLKDKNLNQQYL